MFFRALLSFNRRMRKVVPGPEQKGGMTLVEANVPMLKPSARNMSTHRISDLVETSAGTICVAIASSVLWFGEIRKWTLRR